MLANLISNAIKYSRRGSIEIRVKAVPAFEGGRKFSIKVIDEGIGASNPEKLGKMFKQLDIKDQVN